MSISTQISNSVLERYERDGVVCPPKLRKGLFTTAAVDNIDHNPSSTTSQGSFHGTAISLVQHSTNENPGQPRNANVFESTSSNTRSLAQLPLSYCSVDPVALPVNDLHPPEVIPDLGQMSWSGTDVLVNAGVATQGVADSFITASHLTRT